VVMRDALERCAASLTQARLILSPEAVHDIANRILNPPKPAAPKPVADAAASITDLPQPQSASEDAPSWTPDRLGFDFLETNAPQNPSGAFPASQPVQSTSRTSPLPTGEAASDGTANPPFPPQPLEQQLQAPSGIFPTPEGELPADTTPASEIQPLRAGRTLSRRQVILLIAIAFTELILLAAFAFLVIRNL